MENTKNTTATEAKLNAVIKNDPEFYKKWTEAKKRLLDALTEAENGTIWAFFSPKVAKGAEFSYQNLANIAFTSAGYIRDKWLKFRADGKKSIYDFLLENLVSLTEEEKEALKQKQLHEKEVTAKAESYLESCELNEIEVTADGVKQNAKLLAKFGQEVVDKIVELLEAKAKAEAEAEAPEAVANT